MRKNSTFTLDIIFCFCVTGVLVALSLAITQYRQSREDEKIDQELSTLTFTVNYDRSISEIIRFHGGIHVYSDEIKDKNFPPSKDEVGVKQQSFKFFYFGRDMESDDVIAQMAKEGYRSATIRELLAFGEVNLQRKYPIIALGSVWVDRDNYRRVACLGKYFSEHDFYIDWYENYWNSNTLFMAVHKQ